ncbi:hypothetical protein PINS_up006580 [Pythium insidiosum]|nr:hypothetical protein PINS_up006580 [Pythium insidiosum]
MIASADKGGDGFVDFVEFRAMFQPWSPLPAIAKRVAETSMDAGSSSSVGGASSVLQDAAANSVDDNHNDHHVPTALNEVQVTVVADQVTAEKSTSVTAAVEPPMEPVATHGATPSEVAWSTTTERTDTTAEPL